MELRTVVMARATLRVLTRLERAAAQASPGQDGVGTREPLAVVT